MWLTKRVLCMCMHFVTAQWLVWLSTQSGHRLVAGVHTIPKLTHRQSGSRLGWRPSVKCAMNPSTYVSKLAAARGHVYFCDNVPCSLEKRDLTVCGLCGCFVVALFVCSFTAGRSVWHTFWVRVVLVGCLRFHIECQTDSFEVMILLSFIKCLCMQPTHQFALLPSDTIHVLKTALSVHVHILCALIRRLIENKRDDDNDDDGRASATDSVQANNANNVPSNSAPTADNVTGARWRTVFHQKLLHAVGVIREHCQRV